MPPRMMLLWNRYSQYCAGLLRDALAPAPRTRLQSGVGTDRSNRNQICLEIRIRPSRKAACIGVVFLLSCCLQVLRLLHDEAVLSAAMAGVGSAAIAWGLWLQLRWVVGPPRELRLYPDGRVEFASGRAVREAWIAPCSLRLGDHVVLVLRSAGKPSLRLLLGPGILSAADCAALGRWLARVPGREGTGAE
jgi:hypothetical protein